MAHLAAEATAQGGETRPGDQPSRADLLADMGAEFVGGDG